MNGTMISRNRCRAVAPSIWMTSTAAPAGITRPSSRARAVHSSPPMRTVPARPTQASEVPVTRRLDPRLPALSRNVELVLYRIAQESLTNIARHPGASRVELALTRERAGVLLHIADDGRGLGGSAEGAGIRGLRERAILISANLSLDTRPGGGTMVRLFVPMGAERT